MSWFDRPRAWLGRLEAHGDFLSAMMRRTGASFAETGATENDVRQAVDRCLNCTDEGRCKAWLETAAPGARPPDFCRNKGLLGTLKTPQKAVWP